MFYQVSETLKLPPEVDEATEQVSDLELGEAAEIEEKKKILKERKTKLRELVELAADKMLKLKSGG